MAPEARPHFFDQTPESLAALVIEWGMPRFRAAQVMDWVYRRGVADPQAMTNLSKADRQALTERMAFLRGTPIRHLQATDGTQKLLVEWDMEPTGSSGSLTVLGASGPGQRTDRQTECVMIPAQSPEGRERKT